MDTIEKPPVEEIVLSENTPETSAEAISPAEGTAPAVTEETPVPKFSETFRNKIKSTYPDQEFIDDEAFFEKASEQLDNLEGYRNKNMEANKALMEIFDAEPAIAEVLKDMIKGASFRAALARHFSAEDLVPAEGAPDEEEYKKNLEARSTRLKENEDWNRRKAENESISQKAVSEFVAETNLNPDQATEILTKIGSTLDEVYEGKVTKDFLMAMFRAFNYENDVKTAEDTGKIAGRNEKIETKKEEKPKGDGLPVMAGLGEQKKPKPGQKSWVDETADAEKRKQIL